MEVCYVYRMDQIPPDPGGAASCFLLLPVSQNRRPRGLGVPLPRPARLMDRAGRILPGLLVHCVYLLKERLDAVTPQICRRIDRELESRIRLPFLYREDFWWMGFHDAQINNWNPWIISNLLSVFLYTEQDACRREQAIYKMFECLDHFMATYGADGGCAEGTSYWNYAGGTLFDCVDQLYRASGGAKVSIAREMVWRYGRRIQDPLLMALGASSPVSEDPPDIPKALRRILPDLFCEHEFSSQTMTPPYLRDVWMSDIQVMAARWQEGSDRGFYLAAKGGSNGESHNHNDIGSCIVSYDGIPVLIDVGVETYTAKTFSEERYTIWTMQSQYHNLPTINGCQQLPGEAYAASGVSYSSGDSQVSFSLDIGGIYPPSAGIRSYRRTYTYDRPLPSETDPNHGADSLSPQPVPRIVIRDQYAFLQPENSIAWNVMTQKKPQITDSHTLTIPLSPDTSIHLTGMGADFGIDVETIPLTDPKLLPVWGDTIYRTVLRARTGEEGSVSIVLSAVSSSCPADFQQHEHEGC